MHNRFDRPTAYALCAMNYLVHQDGGRDHPATARRIAQACHIPEGILRKSLLSLSRAGLVQGTQGRGYTLSDRGRTASVLDVLEATGGQRSFVSDGCFMHDGPCAKEGRCAARALYQEVQALMRTRLSGLSVLDLPVGPEGIPVCFQ